MTCSIGKVAGGDVAVEPFGAEPVSYDTQDDFVTEGGTEAGIDVGKSFLGERVVAVSRQRPVLEVDDFIDGDEATVIDAPRTPRDASAVLAYASDLTLVVFQLTVTGVRSARAMGTSTACTSRSQTVIKS